MPDTRVQYAAAEAPKVSSPCASIIMVINSLLNDSPDLRWRKASPSG